ncbi:MAG: hypothetical protein M5U07_07155 [Xanthobacteraceae bacterium]|nr:hypothetical protein [Xanthobacteraceae bacterium]PWB58638.1 MAG: hypothetical protein C3F17_18325 [Bradyrhizobiaceae bacterium]
MTLTRKMMSAALGLALAFGAAAALTAASAVVAPEGAEARALSRSIVKSKARSRVDFGKIERKQLKKIVIQRENLARGGR